MSKRVPRLVTMGETLGVVASTRPGVLGSGTVARLGIAGSESNVAIGVRRLGADATWIGHVGDDPFGRLIMRELLGEGVDVVSGYSTLPTGLMIREQRTQGLARITYHRTATAGSQLSPSDVPDDVLAGADLLHLTGITPSLGEGPAAAVQRILSLARESGVTVSLDINYRVNLWSEQAAAAALRPLLAQVDIVFASEHEASLFTPYDKVEALARALHDEGPSTVVIKLGSRGSHGFRDGVDYEQEAVSVLAVDTVGAGDAFAAGYLAEHMCGLDPAACLATAATMGAFAVSTFGDWEGLPRRDELALLQSSDDTLR